MSVSAKGNCTASNELQLRNTCISIFSTVSGMRIALSEVQSKKVSLSK